MTAPRKAPSTNPPSANSTSQLIARLRSRTFHPPALGRTSARPAGGVHHSRRRAGGEGPPRGSGPARGERAEQPAEEVVLGVTVPAVLPEPLGEAHPDLRA